MTNTEKKPKAAAPSAKLTTEQNRIISIVHGARYDAGNIDMLFRHIDKLNLPDFVSDIDILIGSYLANAEEIEGPEVTALWRLFELNRTLAEICGNP